MLPIDARFQRAVNGIQEVIAMELDMKGDEVRPQHSVKEFPLPRADAEGFGVRPWDVPEEANPGIWPPFFYQPGEEGKVVILNQDEGFIDALELFQARLREFLIDPLIMFPIIYAKGRTGMGDMT